jgi:HPr kinase/phosphorylase
VIGRPSRQPHVPRMTTAAMVADPMLGLKLHPIAGMGHAASRAITHPRVQKTGLALVGHGYGVVPTRVQIIGETELSFLATLPDDKKREAMRFFCGLGLSCVVVTGNNAPHPALVEEAEALGVPVYLSEARSSRTINAIHALLDERLAPRSSLHGVLVDVFTVGVLLLGKSGIGKSECALELIMRGHRLVADDVVHCDWRPPGLVFGVPDSRLAHHLEIRGLGILDVKEIFGITSTRERKRIDLVVRLVEWNDQEEYERLGIDDEFHRLLEVPIREVTVPVRPARDLGAIIEIAARNELLRRRGVNSSRDFIERLKSARKPSAPELDSPIPVPAPSYLDVTTHEVAWDTNEREESGAGLSSSESHAWVTGDRSTDAGPEGA